MPQALLVLATGHCREQENPPQLKQTMITMASVAKATTVQRVAPTLLPVHLEPMGKHVCAVLILLLSKIIGSI